MVSGAIDQQINMWERKVIFRVDFIKVSKVNTNSNVAILFGNRDDVSQPLWILNY